MLAQVEAPIGCRGFYSWGNYYRFKGCSLGASVRVIIWSEEDMYVAREVATGFTSQGKTVEDAVENLRESLELYLEEVPEALEKLELLVRGIVGVLEVEAKASKTIRT